MRKHWVDKKSLALVSAVSFVVMLSGRPVVSQELPTAVGHRGLMHSAPENSMSGLQACLTLKVGMEVDVRAAADGTLVCVHDDSLQRTAGKAGLVDESTIEELALLDIGSSFHSAFSGERIPTFAAMCNMLAAAESSQLLAVDIKAPGIESKLVTVAQDVGALPELLFIGNAIRDVNVRRSLHSSSPEVHVACLANSADELPQAIADEFSDWVYFRYLPTREEVRGTKAAGKKCFIAGPTVSGLEHVNWKRAAHVGMDAVLTDYPLEFSRLMREVALKARAYLQESEDQAHVQPLGFGKPEEVDVDLRKLNKAADLVRRNVEKDELRGAVILVARRGKIILHEAMGYRDNDKMLPMRKDTLFRMASNSKAVTAAGILKLVEQGLIDLDDPVGSYIPTFNRRFLPRVETGTSKSAIEAEFHDGRITIRQLLTHTSGLRIPSLFLTPLLDTSASGSDGAGSSSQLIREVSRFGNIGAEVAPGASYSYNNAGFNTLAAVLEAVTGSYKTHLKESFYLTLGMTDSCNHESDAEAARMSSVFRQKDDGTWAVRWMPSDGPDWPFPRGSGGMVSTAEDYARFCHMLLNRGRAGDTQVLASDLVAEATNPQVDYISAAENYGLGWKVSEPGGTYSHTGSDGTFVFVDPDLQVIGMLLTQSQADTPPRAAFQSLVLEACGAESAVSDTESAKTATRPEGFYKDLFMSSGVSLTSRKTLHAAESLGLSYEYYAGKNQRKQNEFLVGSKEDTNGVLLFPDGQPRFRMVYVNGGGATKHGLSLTDIGRENVRHFNERGGSYCGSCAGSFLSGRNVDSKVEPRPGYLHIFPFNTLNTGMKKARVDHTLPMDSPLLKYRDFGGDHRVSDIYHNNGNWLSVVDGDHIGKTEVLANYYNPDHKTHGGAAIWAYKKNEAAGRVVNIGSHPEGISTGERLELTEACLLYSLDGVGRVNIKGDLSSGEVREMSRTTEQNLPEFARIGGRQYHHFYFSVPAEQPHVRIELNHDSSVKLALFVRESGPAFESNAEDFGTVGEDGSITAQLSPGQWFVSVYCPETVEAREDNDAGFYRYYDNLKLLNGVSYSVRVQTSSAGVYPK